MPGRAEKERVIMTSKRILGMLAVIALLTLSATGAQAGSGGFPSALTSFFVCNSITGDDVAQRVDVDSSSWNFNPQNVRIGNATLMCVFAKLFPGGSTHIPCPGNGCNEINPNPGQALEKQNLKCYSISVPRGQTGNTPPPSYTVTDQLFGTDTNITGSSIQYICAPASLLQNAQ
jgi:hypothetical protein